MRYPSKNQAGGTLIVTIIALLIISAVVGIAVDYTGNVSRNAQRDRAFQNAVEIGDGCIQLAFSSWREICRSNGVPSNPPTSYFNGSATPTPVPNLTNFPAFPGATITNYKVQAVDPLVTLTSTIPPVSALPTSSPPPKATGPGTGTYSYFYLASADVTVPALKGTLTARLRRVFEKRYTSPWNWAAMYNDDLEISPSSALTLNGWVHTNANAYTATDKLTLTDRLSANGDTVTDFAPGDTSHTGITPTAPNFPADLPPGKEQFYAPFGWDPSKFDAADSNQDNDGYHEIIERPVNAAGQPDPLAADRLYNQAGIKVLVDASNTVRVYNQSGTLVTSGSSGSNKKLYDAAAASITTNSTLTDNREGAIVRVVNFDVAQFRNRLSTSTSDGFNGVIYIADTSATSSTPRAVRIRNGELLPTGGITIASENPIYIMGDYNTGGNSPPSNAATPDPTQPSVSGYTVQPSAIMGDAINVLSRNWQDNNSNNSLNTRPAVNTTINAALVGGIVPTNSDGSGRYSGGLENFTRFHENWTGKSFTYYGSMIQLYKSKSATGLWGNAATYLEPANRFWYFDSGLSSDASGKPVAVPGYVSTVAYLQQQRWYLQY